MAKILVVDDDPNALELVELALEPGSHSAVLCERPEDAVSVAVSEGVEAVVLDIMMPGMSGYEVLKALQDNVFTRTIPVLFLSALGGVPDRVRGLREGACDYLSKPFDTEELLLRVEKLLALRARTGSLLQGSLHSFHVADILQQVVASRASGVLEVWTGDASGRVEVEMGQLVGASFASLGGTDAVLALLEADRGEFRFSAERCQPSTSTAAQRISLHNVLMEAAWLTDELERLRHAVPGPHDVLLLVRDEVPELPEELRGVGVEEVCQTIARLGPVSVTDLSVRCESAPQKVLLAVSWLVDQGALAVEPEVAEVAVRRSNPHGLGPGLEALVARVLESASQRGFSREVVHVLLAAGPEQWEALGTLVQGMPETVFTTDPARFVSEVQQRRSGTVRLAGSAGTVLLHVHILSEMSVLRVQTMLPRCSTVALWTTDPGRDPECVDLVELVERGRSDTRGLLIPSGSDGLAAWAGAIEGGERWQVMGSPPGSVAELLGSL